jgi:hypothetical protein
MRTRHAVVTRDLPNMGTCTIVYKIIINPLIVVSTAQVSVTNIYNTMQNIQISKYNLGLVCITNVNIEEFTLALFVKHTVFITFSKYCLTLNIFTVCILLCVMFCGILCVNTTIKPNQYNCLHLFYLITTTCFGPHFGPSSGSFF